MAGEELIYQYAYQYAPMGCAVGAIVYGALASGWVLKLPAGNERMQEIAAAIQEGAKCFHEASVHLYPHRWDSAFRNYYCDTGS